MGKVLSNKTKVRGVINPYYLSIRWEYLNIWLVLIGWMEKGNVFRMGWIKLKHLYRFAVRILNLYLTQNTKLTGRQRLMKLKVENMLSYLLLILLFIFALQCAYIYYKFHYAIHLENIRFDKTGYTNLSCYSNYRDTLICCADRPYLKTSFINSSRKPLRTYECYKYEDID